MMGKTAWLRQAILTNAQEGAALGKAGASSCDAHVVLQAPHCRVPGP